MDLKPAAPSENLLDELQAALAHGTVARRVETLRRVTDLFVNSAVDYSDAQISLFDDVFQCLIVHIEVSARELLANRLAPIDTAPPMTIRTLAFDDVIEVSGPVLSQSNRLDDAALIEVARGKSQAHLMAISTRKVLSNAVTDVLVLRGNDDVIQSTVNNPGAEFSERGFTRLVNRAEGVMILAKVSGMSWSTVRAIIDMRDKLSAGEPTDLQACRETYERLRPSTAQQVLRFHRMQQSAQSAQPAPAA